MNKSKTSYYHDPQWHEEHGMGSSPKATGARNKAIQAKKGDKKIDIKDYKRMGMGDYVRLDSRKKGIG